MSTQYKLSNDIQLFVKRYSLVIPIGAAGAVGEFVGDEILSVTKEGTAGQYTIELGDIDGEATLVSVKDVNCIISGSTLDDVTPHVLSDSLSSTGKFVLQMHTAGTEADVSEDNSIHLTVTVNATGV